MGFEARATPPSRRYPKLMNDFREHIRASANVVLHVGELAYGDRPFEVTGDDPNDVILRTSHELWHKENILNLVAQRFPPDWRYGAVIDGDFHMTRRDWALEAIHQLQHFDFVQLFSRYSDLSSEHRPFRVMPSFAFNYVKGATARTIERRCARRRPMPTTARNRRRRGVSRRHGPSGRQGAPGPSGARPSTR